MATVIPKLAPGERITPDAMNLIATGLCGDMDAILTGRSPIFALNGLGNFPSHLLGMPFYIGAGLTAYASRINGLVGLAQNVVDPITLGVVSVQGVRQYDHSYFVAAAARPVVSYDDKAKIAYIADVPQSAYPPGVVKQNGVGILERSMATHTVQHVPAGKTDPETYYIQELQLASKEGGGTAPMRKNEYTVAEILIEGIVANGNADASVCDWPFVRAHNLQLDPVYFLIGKSSFLLTGGECQAFVRNPDGTYSKSALRYLWPYRDPDPRCFWFHASLPSFTDNPILNSVPISRAQSMQANNLINACVFYDWMQFFNSSNTLARLVRDPLYVMDVSDVWGDLLSDGSLEKMMHHKGTIKIARISRTLVDLLGNRIIVFDEMEYNPDTAVADFAAHKIQCASAAGAPYVLTNVDPDNDVDLIGVQTNLFGKNSYGGDFAEHFMPTAIPLNDTNTHASTPYTLENAVFERGASKGAGGQVLLGPAGQDVDGGFDFILRPQSNYIVSARAVVTAVNSRTYYTPAGVQATVTDAPLQTLVETVGAAGTLSGIHAVTGDDLKSFSYFGNPPAGQIRDRKLTLTPEGWVLTAVEQLTANVLPDFSAAQTSWMTNYAGRKYKFNPAKNKFELPHRLWIARKKGHPYGQFGKARAACFYPFNGRLMTQDWIDEVSGVDGADFSLPGKLTSETGIRVLTQFTTDRFGTSKAGGYFLMLGQNFKLDALQAVNIDGLVAFDQLAGQPGWYWQNRGRLIGSPADTAIAGGPGSRYLLAMPLSSTHYNNFAAYLNACQYGIPLNWTCLKIVYGSKVLTPAFTPTASASGLAYWATDFGSGLPAPMDAFCVVKDYTDLNQGNVNLRPYWESFFAARGVPFKTVANLPSSFAQFRANQNKSLPYSINATAKLSNAAYDSDDSVGRKFVADLELTLDANWTLGAETVTSTGVAMIGNGLDGVQSVFVNLATAYAGLKWIGVNDFKAFCATVGFPFLFSEIIQPLKLDWFRAEAAFESNSLVAEIHHTVARHHVLTILGASGSLADTTVFIPDGLPDPFGRSAEVCLRQATVDALNGGHIRTAQIAGSIPIEQIAFRLAENNVEAEFKLPSIKSGNAPEACYKLSNRTTGRREVFIQAKLGFSASRRSNVQLTYGRVGFTGPMNPDGTFGTVKYFMTDGITANGPQSAGFVPDPAHVAAWNFETSSSGSMFQAGLISNTFNGTVLGATPISPFNEQPDQVLNTTGLAAQAENLIVIHSQDVQVFSDLKIPTDLEIKTESDRWEAHLKNERRWFASNIVSSSPNCAWNFYLAPKQTWGSVLDWWLSSRDEYLADHYFGVPQQPIAIPRPIAPGAASAIVAGAGVNLITPPAEGAWWILYDLNELTISLP